MSHLDATLEVKLQPKSKDALLSFPLLTHQYVSEEFSEEEYTMVVIELGEKGDTTSAQEQFLNTNPSVISFHVSPAERER